MPRKSDEPARPLLTALELIQGCSRAKGDCYNFLRMDLAQLKSSGDLSKAYAGLSACQQVLGPLHKDYRGTLESMRKTLDSYAAHLHKADSWRDLVALALERLDPHITPQGARVIAKLREVFDLPEPLKGKSDGKHSD